MIPEISTLDKSVSWSNINKENFKAARFKAHEEYAVVIRNHLRSVSLPKNLDSKNLEEMASESEEEDQPGQKDTKNPFGESGA